VNPLVLVNGSHACPEERPELLAVCAGSEVMLERQAALGLGALMEKVDGWRFITPVSGWRSFEEQEEIYRMSMAENGETFTRQYVARPGHSEHQTGLAIDLGLSGPALDFIRPNFPYEGVCQRFRTLAADFGFVERYPAGKEHLTGIAHEPWHFRYVGQAHARRMGELGLVLEEYLDWLNAGEGSAAWESGHI